MIRTLLTLAGIFVLAYAVIHLGYAKLEKELKSRSCFEIAGLPTPIPPTTTPQSDGSKKPRPNTDTLQPSSVDPVNNPLQLPPEGQPSLSPLTENEQESAPTLSTDSATDGATGDQTVDDENPDFQIIIRRNIFQVIQEELPVTPEEETTPAVVEPVKEVQTALNLTLLGTVMGDSKTSRAIITEERKNEQKLYQVGDAVQGAIIESIERGKVILDVFGARETLLMKKREGGGPGLPIMSRDPRPPQPQRPDPHDIEDEELEGPDELEDFEEDAEDGLVEEKKASTRRQPPSIRPHRRINFRRNPIRNPQATEEDLPAEVPLDEEPLPGLDNQPEEE
jgi:hypothetical protein